MIRQTLRVFALAGFVVFALGTIAEAAPKKVLHHRARHSARVSAGASAPVHKTRHRKRVTHRTASKTVHHRPTTKPR
jgi:hypothetical protein